MIEANGLHRPDATAERPWDAAWPTHVPRTLDYPLAPAWWLLERNLDRHADRVALRCLDSATGDERTALTYGELAARARGLAAGLRALGVRRGDRVAFYLPNSAELVVSYYGGWQAGAIGVPVNPISPPAELDYQVADAGATILITTAALAPA